MCDLILTLKKDLQAALENRYPHEEAVIHVINESHKHTGHEGFGPNSHFCITIHSSFFKNMTKVMQHRFVYETLSDYLKPNGIHALRIIINP